MNEIDMYWLRRHMSDKLIPLFDIKRRTLSDYNYNIYKNGVNDALVCITQITGIDYTHFVYKKLK